MITPTPLMISSAPKACLLTQKPGSLCYRKEKFTLGRIINSCVTEKRNSHSAGNWAVCVRENRNSHSAGNWAVCVREKKNSHSVGNQAVETGEKTNPQKKSEKRDKFTLSKKPGSLC